MNTGYLSKIEIERIGFKSVGDNVFISSKACFYLTEKISIGNNVRIDDFCLLIGNVSIGDSVHIGAYSAIHASYGSVVIKNFTNISSRVTIYAVSDDYSGKTLTSSLISDIYKNLSIGNVVIEKFAIIGTGSTILEKAYIAEGTAIGAMSLVTKKMDAWSVYAGIPCVKISDRSKELLSIYEQYRRDLDK